ncbi:Arc family DNA-binding protein [Marinobacterium stanieri]|uniref:Arc family DNA-binding protein n=1 Tax=Marinobacterium stanieri TaxID=49186 RepID=UPI003A9073FE
MEPVRITLRLPADVHEKLSESAEATNRSMNAEIVHRLKQSLGMDEVAEIAGMAERMGSKADAITNTMGKLYSIMHGLEVTLKELEVERDFHLQQQANHETLAANKHQKQSKQDD